MMPIRPRLRPSSTWPTAIAITVLAMILVATACRFLPVEKLAHSGHTDVTPYIALQRPISLADTTRDQSMLLDSAPLFLPTKWSTAAVGGMIFSKDNMDMLESFAPELTLSSEKLKPQPLGMTTDKDASAPSTASIVGSFIGRNSDSNTKNSLTPRVAYCEVHDADGDKIVLSGVLDAPVEATGEILWQPVEFWVRVVQQGGIGAPLLSSGSGSDAIDEALSEMISKSDFLIKLKPGYYRIVIGP